MTKRNLTDLTLKALKAPKTGTLDVWDKSFPGFGVRVSDSGRRTFVLMARYPGSDNPTPERSGSMVRSRWRAPAPRRGSGAI